MRVLIAPDKFKHALAAEAVAAAIAHGLRRRSSAIELDICPLADGGEGSGPLLAAVVGAVEQRSKVLGPTANPITARYWQAPDQLIVELAEAAGLWRLSASEHDPLHTTTFGVGQLISAGLQSVAKTSNACGAVSPVRVTICVGGSATVDGGAGCLQALGFELVQENGARLITPAAGGDLAVLVELRPPCHWPAARFQVLCDVDHPALGARGAAPVFAPQKGASPEDVGQLAAGLERWNVVLALSRGKLLGDQPHTGAAGGFPLGLAAALDADLAFGFDRIAEAVGLPERLSRADLVITGEGKLDRQTSGGKVVGGVAKLAAQAGIPCRAMVGAVDGFNGGEDVEALRAALGLAGLHVITPPGSDAEVAIANTAENLASMAAELPL